MEEIDAGDDVGARIREGQRLGVRLLEAHAAPAVQEARRLVEIGAGEVHARHRHGGEGLLELREEAPAAARHVDEAQPALVGSAKELGDGRDRLPPHGPRRAHEQRLDLDVVNLGQLVGEPAARLEVEVLHVIVGQADGLRQLRGLEGALIGAALGRLRQVVQHQAHRFDAARKGDAVFDGDRVKPVANVARVLRLELQHVLHEGEETGGGLGDFDARWFPAKPRRFARGVAVERGVAYRAERLPGEMRKALNSV